MGPQGMQELARLNLEKAHYASERLRAIPWISQPFDQPFFNEFTLQFDPAVKVEAVNRALLKEGLIGGHPLGDWYPTMKQASVWCVTELASKDAIDRLAEALMRLR